MQGRLGPPEGGRFQGFPRTTWRDEFPRAAAAGINAIEWIWDAYGAGANPIESETGLKQMFDLMERYDVAVRSVCADYFMNMTLVRVEGSELESRQAALRWLIGRCRQLGITRIVLPFVDASRIATEADLVQVVSVIEAILPIAEASEVELHLETSLEPEGFGRLLTALPHPMVRVNYDSGNSASLGYRAIEEFEAYGSRVGSVHVKDRLLGGGTVPLGTGDTDFAALDTALRSAHYSGEFVLQAARGIPGDEIAWAARNRAFAIAHGLTRLAR